MSRRPSMWHLDGSHEHILETINKSPHSRWFVEPAQDSTISTAPISGSGSSSQIDAVDVQSVHSETTKAPVTAAVAAAMDSPDPGSPAQGTPTLVRRTSQGRQRMMQMISDFNVHRAGRLGEIEVRDDEDGDLVFDGVLRVYWGVKKPIFISSEKVEDLSPQRRRRSKNILAADLQKMSGGKRTWSQSASSRRRTGTGGATTAVAGGGQGQGRGTEDGRGQVRARSLPDESALTEDTPQRGEEDASRRTRRATIGTATAVKTSAAATSPSSRLDSTPEDAETTLTTSSQPRHHTVSAGTPPTPRTARRRENALNGTASEPATAAGTTAAARVDSRRSSEPAIPKDGELSTTVRKAKIQRSVSTQEGQWKVLVERVNRRAKRSSYHADIAENNTAGGGDLLEYFIPPHGSMSNLRTDSDATTVEVIRALLRKVNAIDEPSRFAIFVVKDNGEVKRLRDDESPMYRRLQLGPKEDLAKLWIMEATDTAAVSLSADVAQFYNLSMPFLNKLVERYQEEEEREVNKIREKFVAEREYLIEMIELMETEEDDGPDRLGSLV